MPKVVRTIQERTIAKIDRDTDCWKWKGAFHVNGYCQAGSVGGRGTKSVYAHRVMYEVFFGPIPEGLQVDHLCQNKGCINPLHLEAVTPRENTLRGPGPSAINARKKECKRGHPFKGDNLLIVEKWNRRVCKICQAIRTKRSNALQAERNKLKKK